MSRTTGRWKIDPAHARTVFGLYTSTDAAPNTTAAAPAASADRTIVPAFPGSRTSWSTATHPVAGTASSATSTYGATPTMFCGVTVEVSRAMTGPAAWTMSTPRSRARIASSCSSSSTNSVSIAIGAASSASRTPWAPSTRNRRSSSRNARFRSRAAAATFGFLVLEITRPPGAPVVRSLDPRGRGTAMRSGGGRLGERVLGLLHERAERRGIVDRQVGEHLAVEFDAGDLQPVHESGVRDAVRADAGVDPGDPQAAELRLAVAPVPIGVDARVLHLLFREAVAHPAAAGV